MLKKHAVSIIGVSPLLLHNGRLADPLDTYSRQLKEISGKRKKTDEDYEEMARIEWAGGMYVDDDGYACLPAEMLIATIIGGAKKSKLGKQFSSSVFVEDDARLKIASKKKAADLWGDEQFRDTRGVKVGTSRVMRTRPRFDEWSCNFDVTYNPTLCNLDDLDRAIRDAGQQVGVGDFRPRFGRFEVQ